MPSVTIHHLAHVLVVEFIKSSVIYTHTITATVMSIWPPLKQILLPFPLMWHPAFIANTHPSLMANETQHKHQLAAPVPATGLKRSSKQGHGKMSQLTHVSLVVDDRRSRSGLCENSIDTWDMLLDHYSQIVYLSKIYNVVLKFIYLVACESQNIITIIL